MDTDTRTPGLLAGQFTADAANDDVQILDDARPRSPSEELEPALAPEPPARRKKRRVHPIIAVMNGVMTLLVVGLLGLGALIYFAKLQFDRPGPLDHSTIVVIPKGEGVNAIAARLEREGVISDRRIFVASVIYFKAQEKLKAGEYEIRKHASMRAVLDQLVRGRAILHKVTIPEGMTSQQVMARLMAVEMLAGELTAPPPEGTLMPDTYKFSRGMTRREMIERMQAEQRKFLDTLWESRDRSLPIRTPREAIILASIVEKETGRADERARIAGVFMNRLRKGMRLQSDPTVIYGLVGGNGPLGRPILKEELEKETPYNTYRVNGLPPGPIANPGRAAIEAVLNPAKTDELYFVADGNGGHVFSRTLAEHRVNVARWREIEREMREKAEAEAKKKKEEELAKLQGIPPSTVPAEPGPDVPGLSVPDIPGLSITDLPGGPAMLPSMADTPVPAAAQPEAQTPAATEPQGPDVPLPLRNPNR